MNINEIIEELKTFSDEDLIKFNKVWYIIIVYNEI